ncbi:MAG: amino acid adenylation domain-containing protein [Syntrophomonadaceae bacterium]
MQQGLLYNLTHAQLETWHIEQLYPGTSIGNIAGAMKLQGKPNYDFMDKAFNHIIAKNDSLRLHLRLESEVPYQYISDYKYSAIDYIDFSEHNNALVAANLWCREQTQQPFNIQDSQLCYFAILKVNDNETLLYFKLHHLISDAWAIVLVASQFIDYYTRLKKGEKISPDPNPSYLDYTHSEDEYIKSSRFIKDKQYWSEKYSTLPDIDTFKSKSNSYSNVKATRFSTSLGPQLALEIKAFCSEERISVFTVFIGVLASCIYRLSGKEDFTIGTIALNRSNAKEKNTVGNFISTLPFRIHVKRKHTFLNWFHSLNKEWFPLLRHQKYPYSLLIDDLRTKHGNTPYLFDIVLSYQNAKFAYELAHEEDEYESNWLFCGAEINPLTIHIDDREGEGLLNIDYDYQEEVYSDDEILALNQHLSVMIQDAIQNPNKMICELEILSTEEKHQLLYQFNNTAAYYPRNKTIHQLFEEQVERTPDNIAVVFEDKQLTYRDLNERSNQLAWALRKQGVQPDDVIAIIVRRSLEMAIGLYGILKAGAAYLPIDPDYPTDRISFMLKDSGVKVLLIHEYFKDNLTFSGTVIPLEDQCLLLEDTSNPEPVAQPHSLAYVIYTSGSTGKPKGAMIEHHSVINRINWMQKRYLIGELDTILQKTPFTFDVSVWELFWWGMVGASVYMLIPGGEKDPAIIVDTILRSNITTMHFVPSMLNMFLAYLEKQPELLRGSKLRNVFTSGEALAPYQVERFNNLLANNGSARLFNLYGPTEATIDVSYYDCPTEGHIDLIPIGKPIDNISLYILDQQRNLLPIGSTGELYISGDGLARGYLNRPELTEEKFVPNPFLPGKKMYCTGDLARWLPDGNIEYLGRTDFQVKIRGNRIELGEIENQLLNHPHIEEAIVVDKADSEGNAYLCAYIISSFNLSVQDLREHLSRSMPDYMIPSYFIPIDKVPLTPNGKLDRKALPEPVTVLGLNLGIDYMEPRNEIQRIMADIWAEELRLPKVGINDNFFALGGNSFAVIRVLTKIFPYNWGISARDFFENPTILELSQIINGYTLENDEKILVPMNIIERRFKQDISQIKFSKERIKFKGVLLTGATGFLGSHILQALLFETDAHVYCLIRGRDESVIRERILNILRLYFPKQDYEKLIYQRIHLIKGDVKQSKLGLSDETYYFLGQNVDSIIHTAAITKFFGDYSDFYSTNVLGTERMISFAKEHHLRLNHISTIAVAGQFLIESDHGEVIFTENDFYYGQRYMENVYVRSKFEAENLMNKAINEGLEGVIYRVGLLSGRYSDGQFQFNIGDNADYNRLKSFIKLGFAPSYVLDIDTEFTPVDYCSSAIVKLSQLFESRGKVFHVYNHNEIKGIELLKILNQLGYPVQSVDNNQFLDYIRTASMDNNNHGMLNGIIIEFNREKEFQYNTPIKLNSSITQKYLQQVGFEWPEVNAEYIGKVLKHMEDVGFLRSPKS